MRRPPSHRIFPARRETAAMRMLITALAAAAAVAFMLLAAGPTAGA
ncbi:hypothetical protein ACO2Q3_14390 [Caulobacter sp. KR2-114]